MTPPSTTSPRLIAVPGLDEIARDPATAMTLPQDTARTLLARCMIVQHALLTPAFAVHAATPAGSTTLSEEDEWITLEEAARILGVSRCWFTRRRGQLPFVKKLSGRTFLASKKGLQKWVAAKTA